MGLWQVTVNAWDKAGDGQYYETVVLAYTERSAKVLASRAVAKQGLTGATSVMAKAIDIRTTGVVTIQMQGGGPPMFVKEAT